jgi:RimJ/RimL family protein N-acetyltransferase
MNFSINDFTLEDVYHRIPTRVDGIKHQEVMRKSIKEIGHFLPWLVNADKWELKIHKNYMEKCGKEKRPFKSYIFLWKNEIVGMGFLRPSNWDHSAEVMYWVNSEFSGLGIGEHIAEVMIREAFKNPENFHVVIKTDRDNVGSKRIMEKIGAERIMYICYYTHEGVKSMMVIWVVTQPRLRRLAQLDYRYMFNPWSDGNRMIRFSRPDDPDFYQVSDPSLIRPKPVSERAHF